ncbi:TetR/AcrR family transcriptional regulator [Pseudonocardia sp. HH130629-09]|uniref:TetR/AcrR family transcriptional regulator n=1 Tax=Pseudonocardia sp. HH130629-09 TaxID=1641402 RepID=UPI0006CB7244|nr:TetR/AcrR family transcriptional regulator [Pseudonocardia sp. HH130629-09]ALE82083.1 hypothetical protein XF36_02155 [Pseudonocardia sp. HH130629-09]
MTTPGRRERKKAATRQGIADAALRLFLDRGFDEVTVAEIAEAADVSVTTLFKHFGSKEALLFDEDATQEAELVAAVRDRAPGTDVIDGLQAWLLRRVDGPPSDRRPSAEDLERFRRLTDAAPSLRDHARRMWARHEAALAAELARDAGRDEPSPADRVLAHVVVGIPPLLREQAGRAREHLDAAFALIRHGYDAAR